MRIWRRGIGGTGQATAPRSIAKGIDALHAILMAAIGAIQAIPRLRLHIGLAPPPPTAITTEVIEELQRHSHGIPCRAEPISMEKWALSGSQQLGSLPSPRIKTNSL
jgi:hypothetical protein